MGNVKMSDQTLKFDRNGVVATLTMNRPEAMNSLNGDMVSRFAELLPSIETDESIRVLVITGNGRAFCAGADLLEVQAGAALPPGEPDFLDRVCDDLMNPLRNLSKPVIAALNGITMAGGLELAMCCDLITAAESAQIGDAHANFGVYPGAGGAAVLPRVLPHHVAKYLLFTGRTLSAAAMQQFGLVNEIYDSSQLLEETYKLAAEVASKSPIALSRMKVVANSSLDVSRDAALEHEQVMLRKQMRSYDMAEGLKAFAEKRKPEFEGR